MAINIVLYFIFITALVGSKEVLKEDFETDALICVLLRKKGAGKLLNY